MVKLDTLVYSLDRLLQIAIFHDTSLNGLQVEGGEEIKKIVTGVTANQALFDEAIKRGADLIMVHHGLFWEKGDARPIAMMRHRLKKLLTHDISLLAYHLPLDYNLEYGNNIELAKVLNINFDTTVLAKRARLQLFLGELKSAMTPKEFYDHIASSLGRKPFHLAEGKKNIKRVAWCTGGAQDAIYDAALEGVDAYITGEVSEQTFHIAREMSLNFYAAGHHATERYGIKALGNYAADRFDIDHHFIDIDNPI